MKTPRTFRTAALLIVGLGLQIAAHCQTYYLTTPVTGDISLGVEDDVTGKLVKTNFGFQTLSETIYLDTAAKTIRQVGFISVTPSSAIFVIQATQQIDNFPNPPVNTPGSVTFNMALEGGGVHFDTGPQPITWNPVGGYYDVTYGSLSPDLWYIGAYSFVTGNFTNEGSFRYRVRPYYGLSTFSRLSTAGYPTTLTLDGLAGTIFSSGGVLADVTAPNGFHLVLSHRLREGLSDCGTWRWSSGPVTATLADTSPPVISVQPQSVLAGAHGIASFSVSANGLLPLAYQWTLNGDNLPGATSSSLTISNVTPFDLGAYTVVVTNVFGTVTSSNAVLSMYPFLALPFDGAVTDWGKPAIFSVLGWGTGPLSYQWFKDGNAIPDATNQLLNLSSIQFTNAGLYSVVLSNPLGSVTNPPAQVVVNPAGVSLGLYPGVTIDGVVGYNYIIQRTADLTDTNSWVTMTNLTLVQPVQLWVDTNTDASLPAHRYRFYRVVPGQ